MYLKEIWRYPVKSMAGEKLDEVKLTSLGLNGDRQILVQSLTGRILTARTHYKLLGFKAVWNKGEILIDGLPWQSSEVANRISDTLNQPVRLIRHEGPERFDILPLLVATDGAIDYMQIDSRRLRPNLIIGAVSGLEERNWPGHRLHVGQATVRPVQLRGRCVMTTYDPDTLVQDTNVLKNIVNKLEGVMALDTEVITPGLLHTGDPVELH